MNKRIAALLVLGLLLTPLPMARAAGGRLSIDNAHAYEGMNASYSGGYAPGVAGGKASIALPLLYEGGEPIEGDAITASLDLGSTADSPFTFANYEKSVALGDHPADGGALAVSCYLVRFDIPLAAGRRNGVYPVVVRTRFSTAAERDVEQTFTVYVTITDGADPAATPKESNPRPQPRIIISRYEVSPQPVMAGEDFEVRLMLLNTEKTWHTKNIVVTFAGETADILPRGGTDAFYIDEIADEETAGLTLTMTVRPDAEPRPQRVSVTIQYEDSARSSYSVTEDVWVEIRQPIRLEFDDVNIPASVSAGDSLPVTMQVINMGKSTLYNVLCALEMPGVIPESAAYLGNLEGGTAATAEIYAFFGTLDMGDNGIEVKDNEEKYGTSRGSMSVTYEDAYGKSYSEKIEISVTIGRPVFEDAYVPDEETEEEPQRASQWWVSLIVLIGIGTILYGSISYRRKVNRLRREYGDEDI